MTAERATSDIPIRSAVIAWQPLFVFRQAEDAATGEVAVFEFLDPRERRFAMTHGACWVDWRDRPANDLVQELDRLNRMLVRDFGIATDRVEAAFARIPEYRNLRADRCNGRNANGWRKRAARPGPADLTSPD